MLQAADHLMVDIYVGIYDLGSPENILSVDLYHHHTCYTNYIRNYETSLCSKETIEYGNELIRKRKVFTKFIPLVQSIIRDGYGLSLSEICNMSEEEGLEISSKVIINSILPTNYENQLSFVTLILRINHNLSFYQSLM